MQQDVQVDQSRAERIEMLLQEVAEFTDPHARDTTEELLRATLDMYGEGLARILELAAQLGAPGLSLIDTLTKDDLVGSLFLLHDLHPIDMETRISHALTEVRPYLKSHGGNVDLVRVENGVAYLRLEGSCHGCSASTLTLKSTIEEAIFRAAPDLDEVRVEDEPTLQIKPLTFVPRRQKAQKNGVK